MDCKCPKCEKRASVDEEMINVTCSHCGYSADFNEYIEEMKERAGSIVTNFRESIDKL